MADFWADFGLRLWHPDDIAHIDLGTFDAMASAVDAARTAAAREGTG